MVIKKKALSTSHQNQTNVFGFLGFTDLPVENKLALAGGVGSWIHSEFLLRVIQSLDAKNIEEFVSLVEKNEHDEEALLGYLQTAVPNLKELLDESVMVVRANLSIQKNLLPTAV